MTTPHTQSLATGGNFQQACVREIERFLAPLMAAAEGRDALEAMLHVLGWIDPSALPVTDLENALVGVKNVATIITNLVENPPEDVADVMAVVLGSPGLLDVVNAVEAFIRVAEQAPNLPAGAAAFGEALLDHLTTTYLQAHHPRVLWLLALLGIAEVPPADADAVRLFDTHGKLVYAAVPTMRVRAAHFGALFADPVGHWTSTYVPDGLVTDAHASHFAQRLFVPLALLLNSFGAHVDFGYRAGPTPGAAHGPMDDMLYVGYRTPDGALGAGGVFAIAPSDRGGPALVVRPFGAMQLEEELGRWRVALNAALAAGTLAVGPQGVTFDTGTDASLGLRVDALAGEDDVAWRIGSAKGTRLEVGRASVAFDVDLSPDGQDFSVKAGVADTALVIQGGDGDGFLAKILPAEGMRIGFHLAGGYSTARGAFFEGGLDGTGSGLTVRIPIREKLFNVLTFEDVRLSLVPNTQPVGVLAKLGGTVTAELGPLTATVEDMGLSLELSVPPGGGNLGPLDIQLAFKPPSGVALSVDAAVLKGGGYLYIGDTRYAGILSLKLLDKINITAIAIIDTVLPGGEEGFALFVLIGVEFDPGIQLSMGFTLNGVGGLLGLNRGMNPEALRKGARDGSVSNILFPKDPLENATAVIASIDGFFPVQKDRFVFGPMVKVGWGSPTLVTLEMGLVLEVPAPVRIALPGVVRLALPDPDNALLELNVSFIGILDFGAKSISIDASIFDSRLLTFTLEGDMAFRLNWGDEPYFLYAMGGFHPAFQPPNALGLGEMRRLSIGFVNDDNLRLTLSSYFALTSNTVQFGAGIELYAKFLGFVAEGRAGFDALFYFNPFRLDLSAYFALSIRMGELDILTLGLDARITGPTPWHVRGRGTFKFLGAEVGFNVDHTFGEVQDTSLASAPVTPLLLEALGAAENWRVAFAPGFHDGVVLGVSPGGASGADVVPVHPAGTLTVRQEVLPLGRPLDVMGATPVSGARHFTIAEVAIVQGTQRTPLVHNDVVAPFAPGQYTTLPDAQKLAAPSFVDMAAGISAGFGPSAIETGGAVEHAGGFESVWIDVEPLPVSTPIDDEVSDAHVSLSGVQAHVFSAATLDKGGPR